MHDHDIGDANVERLLEAAYKPEPITVVFAKQVQDAMCAAARARSEEPDEDRKERKVRRRLGWAMGLAASVASLARRDELARPAETGIPTSLLMRWEISFT